MAGGPVARGGLAGSRYQSSGPKCLLADLTRPGTYGRAYGFERMLDNLGAVGGPLLALGLVTWVGIRGAFLISGVFGLGAAGSIFYAIRRIERPTVTERRPLTIRIRPLLQGHLGRLWIPIGAFEAGNLATTLLILRATELLTPSSGIDTSHAYRSAPLCRSLPVGSVSVSAAVG